MRITDFYINNDYRTLNPKGVEAIKVNEKALEESETLRDISEEYFLTRDTKEKFEEFVISMLDLEDDIYVLETAGEKLDIIHNTLDFLHSYMSDEDVRQNVDEEELEKGLNSILKEIKDMPTQDKFKNKETKDKAITLDKDIKEIIIEELKLKEKVDIDNIKTIKVMDREDGFLYLYVEDEEGSGKELILELDKEKDKLTLRSPIEFHKEEGKDSLNREEALENKRQIKKYVEKKMAIIKDREHVAIEKERLYGEVDKHMLGPDEIKMSSNTIGEEETALEGELIQTYEDSRLMNYEVDEEVDLSDEIDVEKTIEAIIERKTRLRDINDSLKVMLEELENTEGRLKNKEEAKAVIENLKESIYDEKIFLERIKKSLDRKLVVELLR